MKEKLQGLIVGIGMFMIVVFAYSRGREIGRTEGVREGSIEVEKKYMEAILTRHYAYLIKQEGREPFLEYRYITKWRKCPVIHRDADGVEIDKGGR